MQQQFSISEQGNPLGYEKESSLLLKYTIPSVITILVNSIYNLADQYFVSIAVGMEGNAALQLTLPISTVVLAFALLFGVGGAASFNLNLGAKKQEEAATSMGNAITFLLMFGILLSAAVQIFLRPFLLSLGANTEELLTQSLEYGRIIAAAISFSVFLLGGSHLMRADQQAKRTMYYLLAGVIANTLLDALFLLVFRWGIRGAALATLAGQLLSAVLVGSYLFRMTNVPLRRENYMPKLQYFCIISKLGISNFLTNIAVMMVQSMRNNLLVTYGDLSLYGGAVCLAVAGIIGRVYDFCYAIISGLSQGVQPISSFNYGAGKYGRVKRTYRYASAAALCISLVTFCIFQFCSKEIMQLFGAAEEAYFLFAKRFCSIYYFFICVNGLQSVTSNFLVSIGRVKQGALLALSRQCFFILPLFLILPRFFGMEGVLYSGLIADFLAFALTVFFIIREIGRLTRKEQEIS